jgi:hypothetical protein
MKKVFSQSTSKSSVERELHSLDTQAAVLFLPVNRNVVATAIWKEPQNPGVMTIVVLLLQSLQVE